MDSMAIISSWCWCAGMQNIFRWRPISRQQCSSSGFSDARPRLRRISLSSCTCCLRVFSSRRSTWMARSARTTASAATASSY
eukprot:scaffold24180_cov157-Isochrysis_galbana.AAC.2